MLVIVKKTFFGEAEQNKSRKGTVPKVFSVHLIGMAPKNENKRR